MSASGRCGRTASSRLTVVVAGMVAGVPRQGGAAWAVLQYLIGLQQLGHRVVFIEPVGSAHDPETSAVGPDLGRVMDQFGIDNWALLAPDRRTAGIGYDRLRRLAADADVLLDVSGMLVDEQILERVPVRVWLDLDPAFNQLWHDADGIDMGFDSHTHFATVGLAVGLPGCRVPTCGREWITTLPPVVLDEWPVAPCLRHDAMTTVANWRGYGSIHHDGVHYGQKCHSLRALLDLPSRTDDSFVLALAIHRDEVDDLRALAHHGWHLWDPDDIAATPHAYRRFVQGSRAELGIAKSGYVVSRSGWFSDRSACYLASGRPVLAQDTGFSGHLPTGKGLLAFSDVDSAVAGIEDLQGDYEGHRRAARQLAEELFDARRVLDRLLGAVGA